MLTLIASALNSRALGNWQQIEVSDVDKKVL